MYYYPSFPYFTDKLSSATPYLTETKLGLFFDKMIGDKIMNIFCSSAVGNNFVVHDFVKTLYLRLCCATLFRD